MDAIQETLIDFLQLLSGWVEPYLGVLVFAWFSTLLAIFGGDMLVWLKKQTGHLHAFWRLTIFVIFSTFGFTVILEYGVPAVQRMAYDIPSEWQILVVLFAFYLLAYFAKKRGLL
jgi:hypothetical protein